MCRHPFRKLIPEGTLELIDKLPSPRENERAPAWHSLIPEELRECLREYHGLAEAGRKNDLPSPGLP